MQALEHEQFYFFYLYGMLQFYQLLHTLLIYCECFYVEREES